MTLAVDIHESNVKAGWWTDLATMQPSTPYQDESGKWVQRRNIGEVLALVCSEVGESIEALRNNSHDDKLPEYKGNLVELADVAIRIYDLCGAFGFNNVDHTIPPTKSVPFEGSEPYGDYGDIIVEVSKAIESWRKGKVPAMEHHLQAALQATSLTYDIEVNRYPHIYQVEPKTLTGMIEAKRAYNATRKDHTIADRLAAGGKKI